MRVERLLILALLTGCDASTRDFGKEPSEDARAPVSEDAGDGAGEGGSAGERTVPSTPATTPSMPSSATGGAGGEPNEATGGNGGSAGSASVGGQGGALGSAGTGGAPGMGGLDAGFLEPIDAGPGDPEAGVDSGVDAGVDSGPLPPLGECEVAGAEGMPCQEGAGSCVSGQCIVPDKATLGEPCATGDDCGSGYCASRVDGVSVCCNADCSGTCQACDEAGQCSAWPADDDACPPVVCPADTACADYPASPSARCAAFGQCVSAGTYCAPAYETAGVSCGSGLECDGQGACDSVCTGSQTWCVDECVDLESDSANCGSCGYGCTGGTSCVGGDCVCGGSQTLCNGTCVNTNTNNQHCGGCGTSCPAPSSCFNGGCACPTAGQTLCGTSCVDLGTTEAHCGACGTSCAGGETCVQGSCKSWGTPYLVGAGPQYESFLPTAAIDPAGNVFVGFMTDDASYTFAVRRRSAAGVWSGEQIMGSDGGTRGNYYTKGRLGTDAAGNAFVTWGGDASFGYARYRVSTSSWVASAYLTVGPYYDAPEYLTVASNGDAYVAWDNSVASAGTEAWLRRWNGSAAAWASAQQVSKASATEVCVANVGVDANGNGLVVYSEDAQVYARWWQASTQGWVGAGVPLNEGYCFASMAFDGQGTTVVTAAGSSNIYGSSSKNLTSWTTEPLAAPGEVFSYRNHVTAFTGPGGDAIVTLEEVDTYSSITTTRWSAATGTWQGITTLMQGGASEEFRSVAMDLDAKGNGFVATVSTATQSVVGKMRDGASGDFGAQTTLGPRQGGTGTTSSGVQLDVNASGSAVLVWLERDSEGNQEVWARVYE